MTLSPDLKALADDCEQAARAGGKELLAWRGRFQAREKSPVDYVTDADLASQRVIREFVLLRYPDHHFIGEEDDAYEPVPDGEYGWVVDPLDGTTNYVHNYPNFAVSVAVTRGTELLAGAIFDPLANILYRAWKGGGAWQGNALLHVSDIESLDRGLVAVSFPPKITDTSPDLVNFLKVAQRCQGVRRTGSCALNLAHLASGAIDAFWAHHIHPWDVAAGVLLVCEAGGIVTGADGRDFDLWKAHFTAAARPKLHSEFLSLVSP